MLLASSPCCFRATHKLAMSQQTQATPTLTPHPCRCPFRPLLLPLGCTSPALLTSASRVWPWVWAPPASSAESTR